MHRSGTDSKGILGALEPWSLGALEPWSLGALEPRCFCRGARSPKPFTTWNPDKNDDSY